MGQVGSLDLLSSVCALSSLAVLEGKLACGSSPHHHALAIRQSDHRSIVAVECHLQALKSAVGHMNVLAWLASLGDVRHAQCFVRGC